MNPYAPSFCAKAALCRQSRRVLSCSGRSDGGRGKKQAAPEVSTRTRRGDQPDKAVVLAVGGTSDLGDKVEGTEHSSFQARSGPSSS
jgi:hypothetical protein